MAVGKLASHERCSLGDPVDLLGEEALQIGFDAVLDQAGVDTQIMGGVRDDLVDAHGERVARLLVRHLPHLDDARRGEFLIRF